MTLRRALNRSVYYSWKAIPEIPRYIRVRGFIPSLLRLLDISIRHGVWGLRHEFYYIQQVPTLARKQVRQLDYVVVAPDYVKTSAGIRCLYQICNELRTKGFRVAITGSGVTDPNAPIPLISERSAKYAAKYGAWVLYPEIIHGNPLKAKNVIRWVLNRPGLLGGDSVYAESEKVFVYSDAFVPYVKNKIVGKLYRPTLDRSLFFPPEDERAPRSITCFYVGKSKYKDGYVDSGLAFEITRNSPERSELGKLFRNSKVLYCFDNSTALIYEAVLCGCPVVVIPDGTQTLEDYKSLELGMTGIFWGMPEQLPLFVDPAPLLETLERSQANYFAQLENLIQQTCGANHTAHTPIATSGAMVTP